MKLSDFLGEEAIVTELKGVEKQAVLIEMAEALASAGMIKSVEEAVRVLLEREKLGSTGIGDGIAIPHGKLKNIEDIVIAFGRSSAGIDFDSMDGAPVHLVFLLLAPENSASSHLKALALISRLLKDLSFREKLQQAGSRYAIYQTITQEEEKF